MSHVAFKKFDKWQWKKACEIDSFISPHRMHSNENARRDGNRPLPGKKRLWFTIQVSDTSSLLRDFIPGDHSHNKRASSFYMLSSLIRSSQMAPLTKIRFNTLLNNGQPTERLGWNWEKNLSMLTFIIERAFVSGQSASLPLFKCSVFKVRNVFLANVLKNFPLSSCVHILPR